MDSPDSLGTVLVTGGCGRIGSRLVKALLSNPTSSVHVVSRNPTSNLHTNAKYHPANLTNAEQVAAVLQEVKPTVIFHCASPDYLAPDKELWHTNVIGTRVLLQCAAKCSSVKALVYTSSNSAIVPAAPGVVQTEETAKLQDEHSKIDMYSKTKGIGDREVLAANNPSELLTAVLRIPVHVQLGDDKLKYEFCYDGKVVEAHILAAKALLGELTSKPATKKVNGEAFFISDGISMPFFEFARKVYASAGHPVANDEIKVMPLWFMAHLGTRKPELRRLDMDHFKKSVAWKIGKAKTVLGYEPVTDQDEVLKKCVESCMVHCGLIVGSEVPVGAIKQL
ncbi:NAD(P)-binding protein [Hyaloscypha bicolor E]|uniref:NAD(P)-binding protein n=1 Tax=Hyaloscypha bicolor E TaxID=1095630 RepID=A0A2J6TDB2_9HELO|nr:NAD(P)-binding protein [Hyaloscypha bicolor E]PMD61014.1 NAD(P)-binding protein [Hyaloscypha bicolor E]